MTIAKQFIPYQRRNEQLLQKQLARLQTTCPEQFYQAIIYSALSNGKRLRPVLLYLTGEALGADLEKLDNGACAIELIHSYSLVHDDLPAMDNDDTRRGQASCHKAFDEATAILVGDALLTFSFQLISEQTNINDTQKIQMISQLANRSGAPGMISGQWLDIHTKANNFSELLNICIGKTCQLFIASVSLAAIAADCQEKTILHSLQNYAEHLGIAFQLQDDVTDKVKGANQHIEQVTQHYQQALDILQALGKNFEMLREFTLTLMDM